ncbi:MAG: hypothetical protein SH850_07205 [Planctomycetaceae bacterium]|nr:hypothetical protein [Planctomycetaceae bacterium]
MAITIIVVCSELFYTAFCPDVGFLMPLHQCERNIVRYDHGEPAKCPLSESDGSYERFVADSRTDGSGERVVAAETRFFHSQRVSLYGSPLRFAVVLLDNGRTALWYGPEKHYHAALQQARIRGVAPYVDEFFAHSRQRPASQPP